MRLFPMTQAEYEVWQPRSQKAFADDKVRSNDLTEEDAAKIAAEAFARNLPHGLKTENTFLFTAKDDAQNILGYIWYSIRGSEPKRYAYILDVLIEKSQRGKGYGKAMMKLLESEIKKQGLGRISLHVFGYNEVAINLYKSLGYETTDLIMEKPLN